MILTVKNKQKKSKWKIQKEPENKIATCKQKPRKDTKEPENQIVSGKRSLCKIQKRPENEIAGCLMMIHVLLRRVFILAIPKGNFKRVSS